MSKNSKLQ